MSIATSPAKYCGVTATIGYQRATIGYGCIGALPMRIAPASAGKYGNTVIKN
jgi:hypothetical protein